MLDGEISPIGIALNSMESGGAERRLAADGSGRILEDNVYGSREQDALRRDFTVNALYFDPAAGEVIDDVDGVADVEQRVLRCIGKPAVRYREDPVRMLRAVRFAALLDLNMEAETARPIHALGGLLDSIPPPRRFDEMVKMMHSGGACACIIRFLHSRHLRFSSRRFASSSIHPPLRRSVRGFVQSHQSTPD